MADPAPAALLRELASLADALGSTVAPAALADAPRAVTALAQKYFAAAACSIAVVDDDADELIYVAASGEGAHAVTGIRLPMGRGIAGWVVQSGQPLAVSDLSRDARFARDVAESTSYVPTSLLAVPIEGEDRLLGVLSILDRDETRAGAAGDLETATLFAAQAATALEAAAAFGGVGTVLLRALARAAGDNTDVGALLRAVPSPGTADADLAEFAAVLAEFNRCTPEERVFALGLLRDVLAFVNRRGGGRSYPSP